MIQMPQDQLAHISTTIHKLKGSPFTLLIALAVCGGPMNNQEFQLVTGYSAGTVTTALKKLTLHRMVVDTGKSGWALSDGMRQLPLFTEAMLGSGKQVLIGGEKRNEDRKIYDLPPSSSSLNNTHSPQNEEEERKHPQHRKNCDHPERRVEPVETPVEGPVDNSAEPVDNFTAQDWLIRAGISPNSRKFREIIAANPTPQYLQAHIKYFEWWQEQRRRQPRKKAIDGRTRFTTGTLITRILDRDPPPPPRCPHCGRDEQNCICHIIQS